MEPHHINNVTLNTHVILKSCASITNEAERLRNLQEEEHSKLTIGAFFEFMRTAYQVNGSFEGLATILSANSEINWHELAKINLDLETQNNKIIYDNCNARELQNKNNESIQSLLQAISNKEISSESIISSQSSVTSCNTNIYEIYNKNDSVQKSKEAENSSNKCLKTEDNVKEINQLLGSQTCNEGEKISQSKEHLEGNEYGLAKIMKENLRDILHEGLLDSVLPYMLPKSALSQPVIKKSINTTDVKKASSLGNIENKAAVSSHKERDKEKNKINKKSLDNKVNDNSSNEVEIHVCDEDKNIKKNFRCPQKLLIQKMCYFADVTAGQKLDEIDISVHCDVVIFDWLMRWVKKDIIKKSEWPVLEANNVIPIMVSACFLQMEPLLENCLQYCHDNMSDILKTSTTLTCLDDNLLTRLADLFTNEDVEILKDKKDKIQNRLFCKLIMSLVEVTPDNKKGHYSSLSTLFKCGKCNKNIVQSVSDFVPCIPSAIKIDNKGAVHNKHVRDLTWTLNDYVITLRSELRSWRKVYWRLWGDCHFLFCHQCNIYFPIHQIDWCCYHPEPAQFFVNEQQRSTPFPLGRYPCCSQRAYRFEALPNQEGCRYKEHIPNIRSEKELNMLNILTAHREIIAIEPPQLFFPEKITRLVTRDPPLRPGKLVCKDTMWWNGIELVPQRLKFGLLGKIWGGSGFRRPLQPQDSQKSLQKFRRQISAATDISSPASSITDSDDDDGGTGYEDSSIDEESYHSEESNTLCNTLQTIRKAKHLNNRKSNGRCWSGNLNVRHNQDNQRDFEEKAAAQMIALLTKRTIMEGMLSKSSNKQYHSCKTKQPIGGTYLKLEAEFREQLAQSSKYKNPLIGKTRIKSNKS